MAARSLKVLHLATFDAHGGAAVAAIRLVESLRRRGHDARLLVRDKATALPFVEAVTDVRGRPAVPRTDPAVAHVAWLFGEHARSARSDTPFSSDTPTYDVATLPSVRRADVLHLHWVAGFLSAYEIRRLQDLGKPVVWTLHDQFPLTGGCHYAQACRGFVRRCERCPQLQPAAQRLASLTLAQKRGFINPARLALAAPSHWLARCARDSALFRAARIQVIPYGIDVDARQTATRDEARGVLGLPGDAVIVFASSVNNAERRKGYAHLVEALRTMRARRLRGASGTTRRLVILTAGDGAPEGRIEGIPSVSLGPLAAEDPRVALAYRAADVFALPSLEDNLPNTLIEAMAAGLPVVAYRTGGVPDVLKDDVNGRVVRTGDVAGLSRALAALIVDPAGRQRLGAAAAVTAKAVFDWPIQAEAYERMYAEERRRAGAAARKPRAASRQSPAARRFADVPQLSKLTADPKASALAVALLGKSAEELQRVVAARGGEIRDLRAAIAQDEHTAVELQGVIASRGGEIRDLRVALDRKDDVIAELQEVIASRGGEIRELKAAVAAASQAAAADRRHREFVAALLRTSAPEPNHAGAARVGIFGVGEGGRKAFEAIVDAGGIVAWLTDNNPRTHGRTAGGCDVIAPEHVLQSPCDLIVIASAHRDAIRAQLIGLGVAPDRIVAPDVSKTTSEVRREIGRLLERPARGS